MEENYKILKEYPEFQIGGIYEHYKGNRYQILGLVCSAENLCWYVHYQTLYDNVVSRFWVREISDFFKVDIYPGNGEKRPRFILINKSDSIMSQ